MATYIPAPDPESLRKVQHVQDWYHNYVHAKGMTDLIDYQTMRDIKLLDARPEGRSVWSLTIPQYLGNLHGALHGGGAAVLLDMCTMTALAPLAQDRFWVFLGGLTRSLSITYLRGLPVGTPVIIDSTVVQAGRTMALIRGEIKSPDGSIVYVTCDHQKINVGPPPDTMEFEPEPRMGFMPNMVIGMGGAKL